MIQPVSYGHEPYDGLRGDMKRVSESIGQDGSRDVRRIELEFMLLVGL
jgi:hypothetical protein